MSEIVAEGIIQASALREYIGTMTPIVTEGKIHWNDDGLTGRMVDAANVAMHHPSHLSVQAFESYDAPGAVTIGMDFNKFLEQIKPAGDGDLVHLAVDMETRKLNIQFGQADIDMGLIDPDSIRHEPDHPDLDLPNKATVEAGDFKSAIEIVDNVSSHLFLRGDPDDRSLEIYGQGDIDTATVTFGDEDVLDASVALETEAVFSIGYIQDVTDPIPAGAELTLKFGEEFPVILDWEGLDGHLDVHTIVAPRIVND